MAKLTLIHQQALKLGTLVLTCLLVSACGSNAMPVKTSDFSPVLPAAIIEKTVADGSIYSGGINDGLFGDRKAYRVGDIITIILREKTLSEKSASNVTSRKANNTAVAGVGIGDTTLGTAFATSNIDNTGSGEVKQSNTLGGDISATVVRALTNGNLNVTT